MPLCLVPRLSIQTSLFCSCRCFSRSSAMADAFYVLVLIFADPIGGVLADLFTPAAYMCGYA